MIKEGTVYPKGDLSRPLLLPPPKKGDQEMVAAARPNAIRISKDQGFRTHVEKRTFLTDRTEYLVDVGGQLVKVQTPHRIVFAPGEECCIEIADPMWYPAEDEEAAKERVKRQLI